MIKNKFLNRNKYLIILFFLIIILILLYNIIDNNKMNNQKIIAVANFDSKIKGNVYFIDDPSLKQLKIDIRLERLGKNKERGFHIHEYGDANMSDGCMMACAHFNPDNQSHGGRESKIRHAGDLGNLKSDENGKANYIIYDKKLKLRGKYNILGRSLIIHEKRDDLGLGNNEDSLVTGNSGKRVACSPIVLTKNYN